MTNSLPRTSIRSSQPKRSPLHWHKHLQKLKVKFAIALGYSRISHAFGWGGVGGVGGAALHKALDMKRSVSNPPHSRHTPQFLACEKSRSKYPKTPVH
ncbi:hypothetical protein [uncultured Nostoc sp.]|uniref:hypothetical protein n=1 Tax=uncultured Nostoc sp. TaxID=340711 RepID=UPI0035CA0AEB